MTGAKRSGKNTFALFLKKEAEADGYTVELASWANLVKKVAVNALGITEDADEWADRVKNTHKIAVINEIDMDENIITVREFLQNLGTESCRKLFGEDFWVEQFWNNFDKVHSDMPDLLIFTDTRFDNEAKCVERLGGKNVEVIKDDIVLDDTHASESGVDRMYIYDTIYNDSNLDDLKVKTNVAYKKWFSDYLG